MGSRELIEALHRECDEKIRELVERTGKLSGEMREEAAHRIEKFREYCRYTRVSKIREETSGIISEAEKRVRSIRLQSHAALSVRLKILSQGLLESLRDQNYDVVFSALVQELPGTAWQVVAVHPEDEEIARRYFPDAKIIIDDSIRGGLEVMANDGRIRVNNTFEKRLEMVWNDILPDLIDAVNEELQHDRNAS